MRQVVVRRAARGDQVASPPAARPAPVPEAPPEEPGFLDTLLENPLLPIAGGGLLALLAGCRDRVRTALVTTASRANVDAILDAHGLRPDFDVVVTGDDVSRHKPDPEAYLLAAARLAVAPAQCLVFEDSDIGLKSARAAGMAVVRVAFTDEPA